MSDLIEVLNDIGYTLKKTNDYYQSSAVYRGGDNPGAIAIYPKKNLVIDFVRGTKFSIKSLIAKTLKLETEEKIEEWLSNKNIVLETPKIIPKIKMPEIFPQDILKDLIPKHDYWLGRGISLETLQLFKGGVCLSGKMKNRYVFPIFDGKNEIVGLSGRSILNLNDYKTVKYKHLGDKSQWKYPLFLNHQIIKDKSEVILVEGAADLLTFFELGIKNVISLFGCECSWAIVNFLLKYDINRIIISTNNDRLTNNAGNIAAEKIYSRLSKYFDSRQIEIALPQEGKDFNEILLLENGADKIREWYKKL